MLRTLFEAVAMQPASIAIRESIYGYPFLLTSHVVGMCLFAGLIAMMDLRLAGLGNLGTPCSEMQKRLFTLMEDQMSGMPGAKEAKAVMAMMPDLKQAQNLVNAMQGVMASGGPAFSSMQRVMGDFTRMAQQSMPGARR